MTTQSTTKNFRQLLVVAALVVLPALSFGQHAFVAAQGESTVEGLQYGGSIGYTGAKAWAWGAFYQEGIRQSEIALINPKTRYYGLQMSMPLVRTEKLILSFNVRGGLVNEKFVVVVPALETLIAIKSHLQIGIGPSWRYSHAALNARIIIKL